MMSRGQLNCELALRICKSNFKIERRKKMYNNRIPTDSEFPFTIEADPLLEDTAFPTHTHGLTEIGMPEFIMDPCSFGGEGNAGLINAAYRYFRNNTGDLQAVLDGEILKYPINFITIGWGDAPNYTICFRRVYETFGAVKLVYPAGIDYSAQIN
jgi:hypothetical protein